MNHTCPLRGRSRPQFLKVSPLDFCTYTKFGTERLEFARLIPERFHFANAQSHRPVWLSAYNDFEISI